MSSASWLTITGADFATSSVSSKHQLMAGLGRNPRATMAFQGDPACIVAHAEIFAASLPLVFIRRRTGSSICEGGKREPFRTRIYWFFQMS